MYQRVSQELSWLRILRWLYWTNNFKKIPKKGRDRVKGTEEHTWRILIDGLGWRTEHYMKTLLGSNLYLKDLNKSSITC